MQKILRGYIKERHGVVEVHDEPITEEYALFLWDVLTKAGYRVYLGSEMKIFKTKKANRETVANCTVILKGA